MKKFKYPYANLKNVLTFKEKSIAEFNSELVRDYIHCIDKNIHINNLKAANLLHNYKSFKLGNFSTGIIVIFVFSMLLFTKSESSNVNIKNPIEIKDFDKILEKNKQNIIMPKDTLKKEKEIKK